jgi:DNA-binding transcriptional LysR family regulator
MHVELRHLRYFLAVARTGHVTRAAEELGIQQPPLSQQIKALEAELGVQLLRRHPRGVELTEAGRLFRAKAERLVGSLAELREEMQAFTQGIRGTLAVGFTSSAAAHAFTPEALRVCRSRHPDIQLQVSEDNAAGITEAVAAERLHCGILRVPVAQPEGLRFDTLLEEPSVLALPRDHRLARPTRSRRTPVALRELEGESLVLARRPGAPGLYANLLAACARENVQVRIAAEVDRMMTNLNLVAAGVGISVVPASMQGTHVKAIVYRPMQRSARLVAPLTLVYREDSCIGPTLTFVTLVKAAAKNWRQ